MKRLAIITCAAVLGVFATASAAHAVPPEVSKKACEAQGGTLSNDRGMKTCTTVWPAETQVVKGTDTVGQCPALCYQGDFRYVYTVRFTSTQSEKGNGDVTTTTTMEILSRQIIKDDCTFIMGGTRMSVGTGVCDANGVYPTN